MSEELGAVLEAPEVIADEVVDQGGELQADDAALTQADSAAVKEEVVGDWRKVPAELREFFQSPAGKKAKDAWFERAAWNDKFPEGGFKKADEIISFLDEHGGREGLTTALGELQGKAAELDAISEKIQNGDASLVNDLTPETVAKLGPVMDQQWAKADPEAWTAHVSGIFAETIQQNGIPMFIKEMGMMLKYGETDQLKQSLVQLQEWAQSFSAKAQAPRTTQTQQPNKIDAREQALNQREEQAFSNEMKRDVDSFRSPLIAKELDSFFKRRPNDNEAKDLAVATVRSQVIERMSNDAAFQKSLNALTARKDREGAMRLIKSRETAAITEIAPKVGRTIFGNPAAPKIEEKAKPIVQAKPKTPLTTKDKFDAIFNR